MSVKEFMRPRLTGERFENHAIPLEVLGDLAVLEEMVIEVAKWEFRRAHPGRKRSPRGFTEGISLKLTAIDDGSAIPLISLVIAAGGLFPPENQLCFEQARDAIVAAIGAAEQNTPITSHLPEKALGYFDRMGRSLRDGEAIEFTKTPQATPARLTKETRRKLILASSAVKELTEETSIRGVVPEADQDDMSFEVQLADGRKVRAPMAMQHLDTILEAFNGFKTGIRVLLQGVGRFNRQERLQGFDSIEHISILDPLDIPARLDELKGLKDAWLEGAGKAPAHYGLDWLTSAFDRNYPDDLILPHLYPTVDGGVQAEWTLGEAEPSLEIDLEHHAAQWHCMNMKTNAEDSRDLNLDSAADWMWLVQRLMEMGGGVA